MFAKTIDIKTTQRHLNDHPGLIIAKPANEALESDLESLSRWSDQSGVEADSQDGLASFSSDSCIFETSNRPRPAIDSSASATASDAEGSDATDDVENLYLDREYRLVIAFKTGKSATYRFKRRVAKGSYGEVSLLERCEGETGPSRLCIKVGLRPGDVDGDRDIVERLNGSTCQSTIVDSFILTAKYTDLAGEVVEEPVIVMEHMDGSLKEFFARAKFKSINDKYAVTMYALASIATCFFHMINKGLYYTDIKISNCLFRIDDKGKLQVVLGDIGSAVPRDKAEAIATYPHLYHQRCHHFRPQLYDLVYGLLIMFLEMMTVSHPDQTDTMRAERDLFDQLYFKSVKGLNTQERVKIINMLFEELNAMNDGNSALNKILRIIKSRTVLTPKMLRRQDPANSMFEFFKFFKQCYTELSKKSPQIKTLLGGGGT